MRTLKTCTGAVLLAASCAFAQQPGTPGKVADSKPASSAAPQKGLDALLEGKIRASWAAFKNRDKKAYGEFLTDDYVAIEADGEGARNKQHMLRESESSMMTEYALSFFKVMPLGSDAAFVRYEAFFRFPAKSAVPFEKVYISEVWVKRNGQWKSAHYQETRVK